MISKFAALALLSSSLTSVLPPVPVEVHPGALAYQPQHGPISVSVPPTVRFKRLYQFSFSFVFPFNLHIMAKTYFQITLYKMNYFEHTTIS